MRITNANRWLWLVFGVGLVLIVVGWVVDFYSSGDPHFWDTLGFVVAGAALFAIAARSGQWFEPVKNWVVSRMKPRVIIAGVLFAAICGFTAFFWYCSSATAMKSVQLGVSEGSRETLARIAHLNLTYFLPMLAGITMLAFVTMLLNLRTEPSKTA